MTRNKAVDGENGVGMLDTLVATVLLGVAFVAMLAGFSYASEGTRENQERIEATMLLQEAMENLKQYDGTSALDLAAMIPSEGTMVAASTTKAKYTITPNNVTYTVAASAATADSLTDLQAVTLTVSWQEPELDEAEITRSISMVEYIYLMSN